MLTPLEPQSRFGDKLLRNTLVCPQNGTAVLREMGGGIRGRVSLRDGDDCVRLDDLGLGSRYFVLSTSLTGRW